MNKDELYTKLASEVASGKISIEEAEHEYQDYVNPEPRFCQQEW